MAVRLTAEFQSLNGTNYRVELHDQLYTGAALTAEAADNGFNLTVGEADSERYQPIMGSSCSFTYLVDSAQLENVLVDLANSEEKRFQLAIYRNGIFYWVGQVAPDLVEIEDVGFPFYATISATDMLASLDMDYPFTLAPFSLTVKSIHEVLFICLEQTGLKSFFGTDSSYLKTAVHWYPQAAGEWDIASAHEARVLADGGTLPGTVSQLRSQVQAMQAVPLNESFSALVQAARARVIADGGTFVGTDAQILAAYPDSIELREGTPGAFGFDPLVKTKINEIGLYDGSGSSVPITDITSTVGDVLIQLVSRFGARIYFHEGSYCLDQVANYSSPKITTYAYYPNGELKYVIQNENREQLSNASINRRGGGGLTRFFRPLSSVSFEHQVRLNVNLAAFRNNDGLILYQSVPAGSNYSLRCKAEVFAAKKTALGPALLVWALTVKINGNDGNDYYLTNGNPTFNAIPGPLKIDFNWKPSAGIWQLNTPSKIYAFQTAFTQTGPVENSMPIAVTSNAIPVTGSLEITAELLYTVFPDQIALPPSPINFNFDARNFEVYLLDNNAVDNDSIVYSAETSNGKFSPLEITAQLLGDSPVILSPGCLLIDQSTAPFYQVSGGWQRDPDAAYQDISRLHAAEILAGQQVAVQKIDAWFIQEPEGISLRKRLVRGGKAYIFNGVNLVAAQDEWRGTWFEVSSVTTGITTNGRPKPPFDPRNVVPAINEPGDDTYLVLNNAQQFGFDLLRTFRVTEVTADIPAGATTSISISALGEAYLQAGDQLVIVDVATGILHQVTLSAAVSAAANSISINSVTLPAIAAGAGIAFTGRRVARMIKKIDSGTLAGLPVSIGGIGDGASPVQIDTATGNVRTDGDLDVQAIAAVDVQADELTAAVAIKAGTKVTLDAATGNVTATGDLEVADVNAAGNVAAAGNVTGDELTAAVAIKAGTKVTLDAATGNVTATGDLEVADVNAAGNVAAAGNVTGDELTAAVAIKAGTKVTLDAVTGDALFDGTVASTDAQVSGEINVGGEVFINALEGVVSENKPVKGSSLLAGTEVQIDGATGQIDTTGDVAAAGNVSGEEITAAAALKAGTKVTIEAATGNITNDGNVAAGGNVSGDELQASVAVKAGTKVTLDAATGNIVATGAASIAGDVAAGTATVAGDATIGRHLQVAEKLKLLNLPIEYVADNEVYLEPDDSGAYTLKIKLPS